MFFRWFAWFTFVEVTPRCAFRQSQNLQILFKYV